jgi:nucleoid-associated protein YgaU
VRRIGLALLAAVALPAAGSAGETIEHVVEPGDSLWYIAAQADVYADPYLWPVIYRHNRDQIVDPSQIYPEQTLVIPIGLDAEAKARARAEAGAPGTRTASTQTP